MIKKTSPHSVHITASSVSDLDASLNKAVDILIRTATANGCGILVTRHSSEVYTADAHPDVPFGLTCEMSA